ncbi:MAG: hypothetical protein ABWX92_01070 [Mycetocola sp.]
MSEKQPEPTPSTPRPPKRGTVLVDRDGDLWRVSNRGNAYPINTGGHRQGRTYMRLLYLERSHGPLREHSPIDAPWK